MALLIPRNEGLAAEAKGSTRKLTPAVAQEIRERYANERPALSMVKLAHEYSNRLGVKLSRQTIFNILHNRTYKINLR